MLPVGYYVPAVHKSIELYHVPSPFSNFRLPDCIFVSSYADHIIFLPMEEANLKTLYDSVSIENKKYHARLLSSDDSDIVSKRPRISSDDDDDDVDDDGDDDDEDDERKEAEIRRVNQIKVRKSPPIFFRGTHHPSKGSFPIVITSATSSSMCLSAYFRDKATLQAALSDGIFTSLFSKKRLPLPNDIVDALFKVTLLRDKIFLGVAYKAHDTMLELIEREVSQALSIPIVYLF